jgi:hypothetical protein
MDTRDPHAGEPGPANYDTHGQVGDDGPHYTIRNRFGSEKSNSNPSPDQYSPDYTRTRSQAPIASIHVRTEDCHRDATPGPSDYSISRDLGGLSPTLHIRPESKKQDETPGPSDYHPSDLDSGPSFTIKTKHEITEHPNTAPYRELPSHVGEGPKISLSSRHAEPRGPVSPGPSYIPPNLGEDSQRSAIGIRGRDAPNPHIHEPSPADYTINPRFAREAPAFTLKSRTGKDKLNQNPGPGKYDPNWLPTRPATAAAAIRPRLRDAKPETRPGYVKLPSTLGGPYYTVKGREELDGFVD